jgi:hypothetical protein
MLLIQEIAKKYPAVWVASELMDLGLDISDVAESLGYRWVP